MEGDFVTRPLEQQQSLRHPTASEPTNRPIFPKHIAHALLTVPVGMSMLDKNASVTNISGCSSG